MGNGRLFPMSATSFGEPNSGPLVSPVIISELHYEPNDPDDEGTLVESDVEFLEIHNWTETDVDLSAYHLDGDVEFDFADGTELEAGESLVVLPFDPVEDEPSAILVRLIYNLGENVAMVGPFTGRTGQSSWRCAVATRAAW